MLKQFRNLMRMLDELDDEESVGSERVRPAPFALELPHGVGVPETIEASKPATVFVYDKDADHAGSLAAMLTASGTDAETFNETEGFVRGLLTRTPAMVFLDVSGNGDGAIDALVAMGNRAYRGGVQLMGTEISPFMDVVRLMGERHTLQMLPALRKPFGVESVRQALISQDIALAPKVTVSLGEALAGGAVEFWYQPKIDLIRRQIAGVEVFGRISHPELGLVHPAAFMSTATERDLGNLSRKALEAALATVRNLSDLGIHLRIAVNMPVRALMDIPVAAMVRELGPQNPRWPGLLLDLTAAQIAASFDLVAAQAPGLVASKVHLAIDDFNGGALSMARLKELPIAELKLDRSFVSGCDQDPARAKVCEQVIALARHIGCTPVAVGIEQAAEVRTLAAMNCDVGQGFLFGQPMPEQQLAAMLMRRAVPQGEEKQRAKKQVSSSRLKRAVWG